MKTRPLPIFGAAIAAVLPALSPALANTRVEVATPVGSYTMELKNTQTPVTVDNFLRYIGSGRYDTTFLHRSVPGFIVQGGGFTLSAGPGLDVVPQFDPIVNEFDPSRSNVRGTVAMAKIGPENGGGPDTATSNWFVNTANNDGSGPTSNLDAQNGGFTVFAEVIQGMDVVDTIEQLQVITLTNGNPPPNNVIFSDLPLLDSWTGGGVAISDFVFTDMRVLGDTDGDGDVDDTDLGVIIANFNGPGGTGKTIATGDTDLDGDVDDTDLGVAIAGFTGPRDYANPPAAVPEPASLTLLSLGAAMGLRRRR